MIGRVWTLDLGMSWYVWKWINLGYTMVYPPAGGMWCDILLIYDICITYLGQLVFFLNFPTVPVEAKQSKARPDIHSLFASPVVAFLRIGSHCMNKLYEVLLYNISTSIQPRFFPPFVETFVEFFMRYISKKNPEVFTGVGPTAHFSVGTQAFSRPFSTSSSTESAGSKYQRNGVS